MIWDIPKRNPRTVPLIHVGKSSEEKIKRREKIEEEDIIHMKKNIFLIIIFSSVNINIKNEIEHI